MGEGVTASRSLLREISFSHSMERRRIWSTMLCIFSASTAFWVFLTLAHLFEDYLDHGLAEFGNFRVVPDPELSGPTTDDYGEAGKGGLGRVHIVQGYSM